MRTRNNVMPSLTWKALIGLLAFDAMRLSRNFARMLKFVGDWKVGSSPASPDVVDQVCHAINYACVWYPKRVLCLQRSVVTTCLLRSCGVPAQMVIGAVLSPFKAHAWVEVDGATVNEVRDIQRNYKVWERC